MQIITNSEITKALCDVNPTHIAVAYVGSDWDKYIDKNDLKEIIISPTLGSNPLAIEQIKNKIGWDFVHFLDVLHAKFYIGESKAAIGSFNLSKNGIDTDGLEELGVITDDMTHIDRLHKEFSRLKIMANEKYQNPEAKEKKLEDLRKTWYKAVVNGIVTDRTPLPQIENYMTQNCLDIKIIWYRNINLEINYRKIESIDIELSKEESFNAVVADKINVLETDEIESESWILKWLARTDGEPDSRAKPYWFFVHQVIPNGVEDKDYNYTKLLLQRNDRNVPTEPFNLDRTDVVEAFKEVLSQPEFSVFRETDENPWSVPGALETKKLIDAVKNKIKNQSPTPPANSHPDTN